MPSISETRLAISGSWGTVTLTVTYTATLSALEVHLAEHGLGFEERIQIIGDDPGTETDVILHALQPELIPLIGGQTTVLRSRQISVARASLNEDPAVPGGTSPYPLPQPDELLARIEVAYVGLSTEPATADSPVITITA
jgi:hypothetical protein